MSKLPGVLRNDPDVVAGAQKAELEPERRIVRHQKSWISLEDFEGSLYSLKAMAENLIEHFGKDAVIEFEYGAGGDCYGGNIFVDEPETDAEYKARLKAESLRAYQKIKEEEKERKLYAQLHKKYGKEKK
jgi:hypothetical protein